MESDDVSVEIGNERDVAVVTDRELVLYDTAAGFFRALCRNLLVDSGQSDERDGMGRQRTAISLYYPTARIPRFAGRNPYIHYTSFTK